MLGALGVGRCSGQLPQPARTEEDRNPKVQALWYRQYGICNTRVSLLYLGLVSPEHVSLDTSACHVKKGALRSAAEVRVATLAGSGFSKWMNMFEWASCHLCLVAKLRRESCSMQAMLVPMLVCQCQCQCQSGPVPVSPLPVPSSMAHALLLRPQTTGPKLSSLLALRKS